MEAVVSIVWLAGYSRMPVVSSSYQLLPTYDPAQGFTSQALQDMAVGQGVVFLKEVHTHTQRLLV